MSLGKSKCRLTIPIVSKYDLEAPLLHARDDYHLEGSAYTPPGLVPQSGQCENYLFNTEQVEMQGAMFAFHSC